MDGPGNRIESLDAAGNRVIDEQKATLEWTHDYHRKFISTSYGHKNPYSIAWSLAERFYYGSCF
jgi:hypothetical protein